MTMPVEQQIAVLYCGTHELLKDIPLKSIHEFEENLISSLTGTGVFEKIKSGLFDESVASEIEKCALNIQIKG